MPKLIRHRHLLRHALAFGLVLFFASGSSCTFRKILVSHADWLALRTIDQYFDITSDQRKALKPLVAAQIEWIKSSKLAEFRALANDFTAGWSKGLTAESLNDFERRAVTLRIHLVNHLAEDAAHFLASLSDAQVAYLAKKLRESNEKMTKKIALPADEFQEWQRDEALESLKDWFGRIEKDQEKSLINLLSLDQSAYAARFKGRIASQNKVVSLIKRRLPPVDIAAELRLWGEHPELMRETTPQIPPRRSFRETLLEIDRLINAKQRLHAIARIQGFVADLDSQ